MNLKPWLLLLVLTGVYTQFIVLPYDLDASIEDPAESVEKCATIHIFPEHDPHFDTDNMIESVCQRRFELDEFIPVILPTKYLVAIGETPKRPFVLEDAKAVHFNEKTNDLLVLLYQEQMNISFVDLHYLINWDGMELIKTFNYPSSRVDDAWVAMKSKKLKCNRKKRLELNVCGTVANRKHGIHKFVASLGKFSSRGTLYKSLNIPRDAVILPDQNITSVASCRFLYSYYECYKPKEMKCTLHNFTECAESLSLRLSKVYFEHYGAQYTIVAADIEKYETVIGGRRTSHQMDISKHVVLRLPKGSYAIFNGVKIYGRATSLYDHFPIHHNAQSSWITHGDLIMFEQKKGKHVEIDHHRSLLGPISVDSFSLNILWITVGISIAIISVSLIIFVILKKSKTIDNPPQEMTVRFVNESFELQNNFEL